MGDSGAGTSETDHLFFFAFGLLTRRSNFASHSYPYVDSFILVDLSFLLFRVAFRFLPQTVHSLVFPPLCPIFDLRVYHPYLLILGLLSVSNKFSHFVLVLPSLLAPPTFIPDSSISFATSSSSHRLLCWTGCSFFAFLHPCCLSTFTYSVYRLVFPIFFSSLEDSNLVLQILALRCASSGLVACSRFYDAYGGPHYICRIRFTYDRRTRGWLDGVSGPQRRCCAGRKGRSNKMWPKFGIHSIHYYCWKDVCYL